MSLISAGSISLDSTFKGHSEPRDTDSKFVWMKMRIKWFWLVEWLKWVLAWLIDWVVDWLIDRLIDWSIAWLIDWFIYCRRVRISAPDPAPRRAGSVLRATRWTQSTAAWWAYHSDIRDLSSQLFVLFWAVVRIRIHIYFGGLDLDPDPGVPKRPTQGMKIQVLKC
jgi:hypothetical protein